MPGIPIGDYTVTANDSNTGLSGESFGSVINNNSVNTSDVYLEASGSINGTVYAPGTLVNAENLPIDDQGNLITNAEVIANGSVEIYKRFSGQSRTLFRTVQTNSQGQFDSGPYLTLGDYELIARPANGDDGTVRQTSVNYEGDAPSISMVLDGAGSVEGIVLDSNGSLPVDTALVTLVSESPFSSGPISRITSENGEFIFDTIPVGKFSLSATTTLSPIELGTTVDGELFENGQVVLFRNNDADPDNNALMLQPVGIIRGQILLSDGLTPAEGAVIEILQTNLPSGDPLRTARVADATGFFEFLSIPLGEFALSVLESNSGGLANRSVSLSANGEVNDLNTIVVDAAAPQIVSLTPTENSIDVDVTTSIVIELSEPILQSTVDDTTFIVSINGEPIEGQISFDAQDTLINFTPIQTLPDLSLVSVSIIGDRLSFEGEVLEPGIKIYLALA